jgi:hypothetical protein
MWKKFLAETEVCKNDMTLWVQQNIFQLNISIDDPQLQQKQMNKFQSYYKEKRRRIASDCSCDKEISVQYNVDFYGFVSVLSYVQQ